MKVKIKNKFLWNWNAEVRCGVAGDFIVALQKLGSAQWKFVDSAKVRYSLMRNEAPLIAAFQEIEKMRISFLKEAFEAQSKAGIKASELCDEFLVQYRINMNSLFEAEDEFDLRQVKWSQLDVGTNQIGTDVLGVLMDKVIIDDAPKDE